MLSRFKPSRSRQYFLRRLHQHDDRPMPVILRGVQVLRCRVEWTMFLWKHLDIVHPASSQRVRYGLHRRPSEYLWRELASFAVPGHCSNNDYIFPAIHPHSASKHDFSSEGVSLAFPDPPFFFLHGMLPRLVGVVLLRPWSKLILLLTGKLVRWDGQVSRTTTA